MQKSFSTFLTPFGSSEDKWNIISKFDAESVYVEHCQVWWTRSACGYMFVIIPLIKPIIKMHTHTHTHTHIYICVYIYL
jgi:hypothetical protein